MSDPDELYTLRAQYWLGHFQMAIDEAKSIGRRPLNATLRAEREEFLHRSFLALGNKDMLFGGSPTLDALALKSRFENGEGAALDELKRMGASSAEPSVQLVVAQALLAAKQTKEALQCVQLGTTMEHVAFTLVIYLKMERLDLAKKQLSLLRQADEDSILTQLGSIYVCLAMGSSGADDAVHALTSLTEQYGASPLLLNLMACALMAQGDFSGAEDKLQECLRDHSECPLSDTVANMIVCAVHQDKPPDHFLSKMSQSYPSHEFCLGLERATNAFNRETVKYKV